MYTTYKELQKPLRARLLHSVFLRFITSAIFPFLSIYLLNFYTVKQISFILMGGAFSSILGQNFFRNRSLSIIEERKALIITFLLLIVTQFLLSITTFFYSNFSNTFINYGFVSLLLSYYFFSGMLNPLIDTLIYPLYTEENKRKIASLSYILTNVSSACGILIGKFTKNDHVSILFLCMMVLSIFSMITFSKAIKRINPSIVENSKDVGSKKINKTVLWFSLATCFAFFLESRLSDLLVIFLYEKGIEEAQLRNYLAYVLLINYVIAIFGSSFVSEKLKKYSSEQSIKLGMIILCGSYSSLFLIPNPLFSILIFIVVYTVGESVYFTNRQLYLISLVEDRQKAISIFSTDRTVMSLAKVCSVILLPLAHNEFILVLTIMSIGSVSLVLFSRLTNPVNKVDFEKKRG